MAFYNHFQLANVMNYAFLLRTLNRVIEIELFAIITITDCARRNALRYNWFSLPDSILKTHIKLWLTLLCRYARYVFIVSIIYINLSYTQVNKDPFDNKKTVQHKNHAIFLLFICVTNALKCDNNIYFTYLILTAMHFQPNDFFMIIHL